MRAGLRSADRAERGMTVVELLIALGLSAVVMMAAFAFYISTSRVYGSEEGFVRSQQAARLALDMMQYELSMAGLGFDRPGAQDGDTMAISPGTRVLGMEDILEFRANLRSGMVLTLEPVPVGGGSQTVEVEPAAMQRFGMGDLIAIFNLDRELLSYGQVQNVTVGTGRTFLSLNVDNGSVTIPNKALVMHRPRLYRYSQQQNTLVRCVANGFGEGCEDQQVGVDVVARNLEEFQLSFLLKVANGTAWVNNVDPIDPETRRNIIAFRVEVMVRNDHRDDAINDTNVYEMGDQQNMQFTGQLANHQRRLLSTIIRLPNMIE